MAQKSKVKASAKPQKLKRPPVMKAKPVKDAKKAAKAAAPKEQKLAQAKAALKKEKTAAVTQVASKAAKVKVQPLEKAPAVDAKAVAKGKTKAPAQVKAAPATAVEAAPEAEAKPAKISKARAKKLSISASASEAASALASKWQTLSKKSEQIETKPYNMKGVFEEKTGITHKIMGWGYILANRNDRLEVLFKDGIKYLISNYKP